MGAFSRAEGWKDVLQKSEKMEKLVRALSVNQQGMLRNNPRQITDSVNEANEVLSGMLNTRKCLPENGVEIQKRLDSPLLLEKGGYLSQTALCVPGRYPKKDDNRGEEGCSFCLRGKASQERGRAVNHQPTLRPPEAHCHRNMGNSSWWEGRKR